MPVLRVKQAFAVLSTGELFNPGRLVLDTDPAVKGREGYFEAVEEAATRTAAVEQTTAAPGELRSVLPAVKPAKKTSAAKKAASKDKD